MLFSARTMLLGLFCCCLVVRGYGARKPYGWFCAQVIGAKKYQAAIEAPLAPGDQLRNSYWNDFRLLQVLDILVEHNFPFSKTYLTKAKREEVRVNTLIADRLQQPAATISKFFSAVGSKHGSFSRFAILAGVPFDVSYVPEPCVVSYKRVASAVAILMDAGISTKSEALLNYYPDGNIASRWAAIFGCEMTGPLLWRAARQFGYRVNTVVTDIRRTYRRNLELTKGLVAENPGRLTALQENLVSKADFSNRLTALSQQEITVYLWLYDFTLTTTEVVTPSEAVIGLMSAFLMKEDVAIGYFRAFAKQLMTP